ncbi:MAG: RHS repeat-associated core domain-containing protein, partial [Flavobacteriales bacterium]|nr:RHS repeat-associated core domain-containing protein [Flavobacteriales bacterium]
FGSPMPGRSFGKSRYGFNGKEMDDEVYSSTGTSYDYGFRIYNPRLGRFLSVDPLTDKFPMLTPYQFASNTPIWAIDLDGLEARVYTDLSPILNGEYPHSFLSVIDDEGVINVYTYGQYGQKGIAPLGEGALVHLKGADANSYIKNEFKEYPMRVFEISDKAVDKQKIIDYYSNEMKSYNIPAERKEPHAPNYVNEENGSSAVKYKPYYIFADGKLTENCTSCMQDGLKEGGFNMDFSAPVPYSIDNILKMMSIIAPGTVKDVTGNEKNAANNNFNAPVTLPTVTVTPE